MFDRIHTCKSQNREDHKGSSKVKLKSRLKPLMIEKAFFGWDFLDKLSLFTQKSSLEGNHAQFNKLANMIISRGIILSRIDCRRSVTEQDFTEKEHSHFRN